MAEVEIKQFKVSDEGVIFFQPDPTNPLPGKPVGKIGKGEGLLQPVAIPDTEDFDAAVLTGHLQAYVNETLQPLIALKDEEEIEEAARNIANKLYDALGILPREELEDDIAKLTEAGRGALRARKVRLGPVLVFLPLLNKPAGVHLRAMLWNIWNGKALPAEVPKDGVTSISVAERTDVDPLYFRSIGYPVYGPRVVRVDMLDRLICAIYDGADKGLFKAQHQMAEWLGCPISDLYQVLEAMGHTKVSDPANDKPPETTEANEEPKAEAAPAPVEEKPEATTEKAAEDKKEEKPAEPQEKPELATFRLKRGKAYSDKQSGKPRGDKKFKPSGKKSRKDNRKGGKPHHKGKGEPKERVISAPAKKVEASPFAALKDLKVQGKE